jgi:hypothetical protein
VIAETLRATPARRRLLRIAGVVLIAAGAAGFALAMFIYAGTARPEQVMIPAAVAAGGVLLLRLSRSSGAPERDRGNVMVMFTVFFTFATLGPLLLLVFDRSICHLVSALTAATISGLIATGWAASFVFRAFWLLPLVIGFQVWVPIRVFNLLGHAGLLENFWDLPETNRLGLTALVSVSCLVLGYVLFVIYVRRVERAAVRAEAELATAAEIHHQLVPNLDQSRDGYAIAGRSVPSTEMGGDLLSVFPRAEGFDLVLADVSGHGVRAGVVMAMVKGVISAELARHGATLDEAVRTINRAACALTDDGTFITAVFLRAGSGGAVQICNCGHPPVLVGGRSGVRSIGAHGLPLGIVAGESFGVTEVMLAGSDAVLVYSDGLSETRAPSGALLGTDPLADAFGAASGRGAEDAARAIVRAVFDAAEGFAAGRPAADDRTAGALVRADFQTLDGAAAT